MKSEKDFKVFSPFTFHLSPRHASLVQLVERRSPKPDVEGSSPSGRDLIKKDCEQNINLFDASNQIKG